jgi:hypothetical protein
MENKDYKYKSFDEDAFEKKFIACLLLMSLFLLGITIYFMLNVDTFLGIGSSDNFLQLQD